MVEFVTFTFLSVENKKPIVFTKKACASLSAEPDPLTR